MTLAVGLAFASGEAKLNLGATAIIEVDRQRHDRHPFAPDSAQ